MSDDDLPMTQADGSLEPPRKPPGTAVATSAPLPEPVSGPVRWMADRPASGLTALIDRALDVLDRIGDTVREAFVAR